MEKLTRKNIEAIIISHIAKEKEGYSELLSTLDEKFFSNENLRKAFSIFKEQSFLKNSVKPENVFLDIGLDDRQIAYIMTVEYDHSMNDIRRFLLETYKQRLIEESIRKTSSEKDPEKRKEIIKKLNEELSIEFISGQIMNNEACLERYQNYYEEIVRRNHEDGAIGISTGIEGLDEKIIGLKNSEYILVAARPSMGKTSLTTGFFIEAIRDTKMEGVPVMFSLEMDTEQIIGRMIAQVNEELSLSNTIFGKESEKHREVIEDTINELKAKEFYIEDFKGDEYGLEITPLDLDRKLMEIEKEHGKIKLILIDYLQLLSPSSKRMSGQNERMTDISSKIKALGRKYGCPVVALSQLNRDLEKRQDKRPQLSDLRESGALEQDADIILFVYRPEVYLEKELKEKLKGKPNDESLKRQLELIQTRDISEAEIIIGKQRNGPTGIVNTYFHKKNAYFADVDDETVEEIRRLYEGDSDIYEDDDIP